MTFSVRYIPAFVGAGINVAPLKMPVGDLMHV